MTPSTIMAALVEVSESHDRPRTLARALGVDETEGAVELIRRALQAERYEAEREYREREDW